MGEEAINYCRSYALEAERKIGELLKETERQHPGEYQRLPDVTVRIPPTLSELGLTKRESAEAQMLASMPEAIFEKIKTGEKTRADIKRENKRKDILTRLENIEIILAKNYKKVSLRITKCILINLCRSLKL